MYAKRRLYFPNDNKFKGTVKYIARNLNLITFLSRLSVCFFRLNYY